MPNFRRANLAGAISQFVTVLLTGSGNTPQIGLGPVVWNIKPGHDTRFWYFTACSIQANNSFHVDMLSIQQDDRLLAEQCRVDVGVELIRRRPCVIIDFDDELELSKWLETQCPGDRSRRMREGLERERGSLNA